MCTIAVLDILGLLQTQPGSSMWQSVCITAIGDSVSPSNPEVKDSRSGGVVAWLCKHS